MARGLAPRRARLVRSLRVGRRLPVNPEEQAEQEWMNGDTGYKGALLSTLKRTRELLAEGRL
ncbi:hypothetical protein BE11_14695 [Sorangium cellulosum]|nr:hypothetical protein BE11_14695 [Sorangium cellulosum]